MGLLDVFKKEYTIQYHLVKQAEAIDIDRLTVYARNHSDARKAAEKKLRQAHGRTQYKIEWIQRA